MEQKTCTHVYLSFCKTNPQPPGFGDFLRGTIALFNYCKTYGYDLFVDNKIHPLFSYLKDNEKFIDNYDHDVHELIPTPAHCCYFSIDNQMKSLFEKNETFSCMTNGFYDKSNGSLRNFGEISMECKLFLKDILTPNEELTNTIQQVYDDMNIDMNKGYSIIHLRFGDNFLHHNAFDNNLFNHLNGVLLNMTSNKDKQFILLTDSQSMGSKLKESNPLLFYWDSKKIHLGDLTNYNRESIKDTMVDFFIITKCEEIFSLNNSGFSKIPSLIYDIKYNIL